MATKKLQILGEFGSGNTDYEKLQKLPKINDVPIIGEKKSEDYGLQGLMSELSTAEIIEIWNNTMNE